MAPTGYPSFGPCCDIWDHKFLPFRSPEPPMLVPACLALGLRMNRDTYLVFRGSSGSPCKTESWFEGMRDMSYYEFLAILPMFEVISGLAETQNIWMDVIVIEIIQKHNSEVDKHVYSKSALLFSPLNTSSHPLSLSPSTHIYTLMQTYTLESEYCPHLSHLRDEIIREYGGEALKNVPGSHWRKCWREQFLHSCLPGVDFPPRFLWCSDLKDYCKFWVLNPCFGMKNQETWSQGDLAPT